MKYQWGLCPPDPDGRRSLGREAQNVRGTSGDGGADDAVTKKTRTGRAGEYVPTTKPRASIGAPLADLVPLIVSFYLIDLKLKRNSKKKANKILR